MMAKIRKYGRYIATIFLLNFLFSLFSPSMSYALTSGPSSPEFSDFEPVTTTDMVNLFSGDMVYNLPVVQIPGPDGAGYALSLSYHGGNNSESEASWVGHGWTLNPGAINRDVNGYPDDYKNAAVEVYNKTRPNWTVTSQTSLGIEAWSQSLGINASVNNRYNNYMGFSNTVGLGINALGGANIGISYDGVEPHLSVSISPIAIMNKINELSEIAKAKAKANQVANNHDAAPAASKPNAASSKLKVDVNKTAKGLISNFFNISTMSRTTLPTVNKPYHGIGFNFAASIIADYAPMTGSKVGIEGGFNAQVNEWPLDQKAYGYLHTPSNSSNEILEDFVVEKQSQFNKQSRYIGIPFNAVDNFILTGEDLGGGFQAFRGDMGHYVANTSKSESKTYTGGLQFHIGVDIGLGIDIGGGKSALEVRNNWDKGNWAKNNQQQDVYKFEDNPQTYMRFTNDLGGEIDYANTDNKAFSAKIDENGNYPELNSGIVPENLNQVSSHITTRTKSESGLCLFKDPSNLIYKEQEVPGESIREIDILKSDGSNYVYGIPVFVKNEIDISVGRATDAKVENNLLMSQAGVVETGDLGTNHIVVGTKKVVPYAKTYLLTQITGSNYYDVGDNGPDEADYGAWTKFNYKKKYGGSLAWYNYRTPYNGLSYSVNSLSLDEDDMGFLSRGEKEVYYVKSVETKTHVAFFITNKTTAADFESQYGAIPVNYLTGSGDLRHDGFDAGGNAASSLNQRGTQGLEKLERIVLFSKNRLDKPIKVVHFQYDDKNNLVKRTANNENANSGINTSTYNNSGKLTLKKVWFEYEGIVNSRISPYEFYYEYFNNYSSQILSEYPELADYNALSQTAQNPDYQAGLLDPWGNIQYQGPVRAINFQNWPYQGNIPKNEFDPAAWQLKRIKLPSGGEIHVQYEQKDYNYVQNRKAMALVSLNSASGDIYELNLKDIGLVPGAYKDYTEYEKDVNEIIDWLKTLKENAGSDYNKLFFKFLYGLSPLTAGSLLNKQSDYVSGYTSIKAVTPDKAENGNGSPYTITIELQRDDDKDRPKDFAIASILTSNKTIYPDIAAKFNNLEQSMQDEYLSRSIHTDDLKWKETIKNFVLNDGASGLFKIMGEFTTTLKGIEPGAINSQYSYFKIIDPRAKRGGGVRVKRLLMYDPGFEGVSGSENIYGNEYFYEQEDGSSSGVATNEPEGMREENALVGYLDRGDQSGSTILLDGRDRNSEEGPIGENVLPGATVGHSRVVVENIHKGNTGTGHVVYEYHTVKDYYFDRYYSATAISGNGFEATKLNQDKDDIEIPAGIFNYYKKHDYATQGFRFIINNMHGQQKKITSYGGKYGSDITYVTGKEEFEYFEPGEPVDMIVFNQDQTAYSIVASNPGKEMEIAMHLNSVKDFTWNFNLNVDIAAIFVAPLLSLGFNINIYNNAINTHAISKVISYPAILKKKTSTQDNIKQVVENVYFDQFTGQAVVTKSYDEYDGLKLGGNGTAHDGAYYATDLKASWFYPEMGPKWKDENNNSNELNQSVGSIVTYQNPPFNSVGGSVLTFDKVVSASMQTFHLPTDNEVVGDYTPLYMLPWSSYAYKTASVNNTAYTYQKGWSTEQLNINLAGGNNVNYFSWNSLDQPKQWIRSTTIEKYSAAGIPLQEKNAMNIYSSAKYGYNDQLPVLVAQNAQYNSVYFYDFEVDSDCPTAASLLARGIVNAHSGSQSISINSEFSLGGLGITSNSLMVKFWLKSLNNLSPTVSFGSTAVNAKEIASSGEWKLYEATISGTNLSITAISINPGGAAWIDDLRIQPLDAEMKTFVYDKNTFRLLCEFDNQHFGLFYQYNDEGKLVRKIIETERGRFTVQEKQYNQVKIVK